MANSQVHKGSSSIRGTSAVYIISEMLLDKTNKCSPSPLYNMLTSHSS